MSFYKKYELDRLIADGDARTFRALENATGRVVFLHLFNPSGQPLLAAFKSSLSGQGGRPIPPLIEIGDFAGAPYAVTEAIEPFGNLRDWIAANVTRSGALLKGDSSPAIAPAVEPLAPAPPPPPAPVKELLADGPGDFAHFFEPSRTPEPPAPLRRAAEPPAAAPPAGRLLAEEPGDFTRLFEPPKASPPPPAAPPSAGGLVAEEAGEFTRLFEPPKASPPPPAAPPSAAGLVAEEGGEFTRLFVPPKASPPPPAAPPSAGGLVAEEGGKFTRLFVPPRASPPPPAAPPSAGGLVAEEAGEFTRLFEPPKASPPRRTPQSPAGGFGAQPPGEFTKLFEPIKPPQPSSAPPPSEIARPPLRPPAPEPADTGDFTRLFGARLPGEHIDIEKEHASASLTAPPESRPFQAASEFTRMFGPQGVQGGSTTEKPLPPEPSGNSPILASASGMFGDPNELARIAAEALAASKTGDWAPGEYTKSFGEAGKPQEPPSKPAAPPAHVPEAVPVKKSNRDLIVIVVSVLVLVALIVAAIFLRK